MCLRVCVFFPYPFTIDLFITYTAYLPMLSTRYAWYVSGTPFPSSKLV